MNWAIQAEDYRDDFPALQQSIYKEKPLVYLDNAASTQRPQQVTDFCRDMEASGYANVHRGVHWLSDQATEHYEAARLKMKQWLGAEHAHEIIFTSGTTAGINLVAHSWGEANLTDSDEIILSLMEHHSNIVPWQLVSEKTGCQIRWINLTDDGLLDMQHFQSLLSDQTRLVAVTAASNVLGTINPVADIIGAAHGVGAKVLLDAAQSVPHLPVNVHDLDVDFLALSGHKMIGSSGVGVLYGKESLLEEMPPFLGGGSMISTVTTAGFKPGELPAKFEAGTPPIVPAAGLLPAIEYLERVGLDKIHQYEQQLARYAHERLSEIETIRFLGPEPEKKGGIVSFVMDDVQASDLAQMIDRQGVAIRSGHHCTMPLHDLLKINASARASFYFYNTPSEVDMLLEAILKVRKLLVR